MEPDYIIIKKYIEHCNIEPDFIHLLEENGLIHIYEFENERFLHSDELADMERFARLYYDLSINIEGIDVIQNLLNQINGLQEELKNLRSQLRLSE
ncbi:MAG: chaperone modulator CbpM [Dysgonamonadaceae bacterium]|jgi:hypothetical protein|nr:chaperone modulator CbpM [Dysgonamonadaceae bacterium]